MVFQSNAEPMINYIVLSGTIERKNALSRTSFGGWVLELSVRNMTERRSSDDSEVHESVSILKVEAWNDLAREMNDLLEVGSMVLLEGQLVSRKHEDRTKATHHRMVVKAWRIQPLDTVG